MAKSINRRAVIKSAIVAPAVLLPTIAQALTRQLLPANEADNELFVLLDEWRALRDKLHAANAKCSIEHDKSQALIVKPTPPETSPEYIQWSLDSEAALDKHWRPAESQHRTLHWFVSRLEKKILKTPIHTEHGRWRLLAVRGEFLPCSIVKGGAA